MNRTDVQNRLVASGLISSEVTAELALYDGLSPSDQALYQDWMEEVSNADIATRVRSGNPARVPPIYTHDTEGNPPPSSSVLVGKAFVVAYDAGTRPAGVSVVQWATTAQPSSPQTDDQWMKPADSTLKRWNGSAWITVNISATGSATYYPVTVLTNTATTDIDVDLAASIAAGAKHILIPNKGTAWPALTQLVASDVTIEFEPGASITVDTPREVWDLTRCRTLGPVKFVSTYTGPSSAADDTNGKYGLDVPGLGEVFPRSVILRDGCVVQDGWYQSGACSGIQQRGTGIRIYGPLEFHQIRHRKGWGSAIHTSGASDIVVQSKPNIVDSDRGCETEQGSVDITFTSGGEMTNVYPPGYTGQPGDYATYTFCLDAHTHAGEGAPVNIRYEGLWTLTNCGAGVTFIRSTGTNVSDMPRNCYVEHVRIVGRGLATGYEDIAAEGYDNRVDRVDFEEGAGIAGTNFRIKGYAVSRRNVVGLYTAKTTPAIPVITDSGSGLYVGDGSDTGLLTTLGYDPGIVASYSAGGSQTWPTANDAILVRMRCRRPMVINKLVWNPGAAVGNYDIGLYDGDGNRLWSKGSTAVPGTSVITETVSPGVQIGQNEEFYVALASNTATTFTIKGAIMSSAELTKGVTGRAIAVAIPTSMPLPATVTLAGAATAARIPMVTVRES